MENIIITDKKNRNWLIKIEPLKWGEESYMNFFVEPCNESLEILAGVAGYCIEREGKAKLNNILVYPEYEDSGIGSKLMEEIEKSAVKMGINYLYGDLVKMDAYNLSKLEHIYKKHGWIWRLFKIDNLDVLEDYEVIGSVEKAIKA